MGANADLTAYFKEIAENLLAISHTSSKPRFFRTELDEFMNTTIWPLMVPACFAEQRLTP
jgi:hypothetical protein